MSSSSWIRFARSALVGLVASACDVLALCGLIELTGLSAVAANVPALLVGVAVQYAGNKRFAFEDRSRHNLRQAALFAGIELGSLALNAVGFHLLCTFTRVPYGLARALVSLAVYSSVSFPLWSLVFRPSAPSERTQRRMWKSPSFGSRA